MREYRAAAESYAKVAGWMTDAAQSNVTIDARRQVAITLSKLSENEIRALAHGQPLPDLAAATDNELTIDDVTDNGRY